MTHLTIVGMILAVAIVMGIIWLIRRRRLQERYAIIWICAAAGVLVFGIWTDALDVLANVTGIAYPPSALFLVVAIFLVLMLLHNSVTLSRLSSQNEALAQRIAMLDEALRRSGGGEDSSDRVREPLPPAPKVIPLDRRRAAERE